MATSQNSDVVVNIKVKVGSSPEEVLKLARDLGVLNGKIKDTSTAARGLGSSSNSGIAGVGKLSAGVLIGNAAFAALRQGVQLARKGISEFEQAVVGAVSAASAQQVVNTQLALVLKNVGEGASGLYTQIQGLSTQYQKLTGVGDDVIASNAAQLVAFGATGANIERVTKAALDLSTAMGRDLNGASLLVGKALQGQFTTLARYGIIVDESATKAQKLEQALKTIESRFGGSAAAQVANVTGQYGLLGQMLGELSESFGNAVVNNGTFLDALKSANTEISDLTGTVDGLQANLTRLTTGALKAFADLLPFIVEKGIILVKMLLDLAAATAEFVAQGVNIVTYLGGLTNTVIAAAVAVGIYRTAILALRIAHIALAESVVIASASVAATPWGVLAKVLGPFVLAAVAASGVIEKLNDWMFKTSEIGGAVANTVADVKNNIDKLHDPLVKAADGFKRIVDESSRLNLDFDDKVQKFSALQEELSRATLNKPQPGSAEERLIRPSELNAAKELIEQLDLMRIGFFAIANAADAAGIKISEAFIAEAAARGVIVGLQGPPDPGGTRVPGAGEKDPKADALKTLLESIEAQKEENRVRQEGINIGRDVAVTDAMVTEQKNRIKTGSAEAAATMRDLEIASIDLLRTQASLKALQDDLYNDPKKLAEIQAQTEALAGLNTVGLTDLQIKKALAEAAAKVQAANAKQTGTILDQENAINKIKIAEAEWAKARKENAATADAAANLEIAAKERELALLEQVHAGIITLKEEKILLAAANAEAIGQSGALAAALETENQAVEKLSKRIQDTTINLTDSLSNIIDGFVTGILAGTNKGLDMMRIFKDTGKALFGDMLKGMIKDKLSFFDEPFSVNFLRDLPKMVETGVGLMQTIFAGGLNDMISGLGSLFSAMGGSSSGTGFWGSLFSGAVSLFGGSSSSANGSSNGGNGGSNLGSQVSFTGSTISFLKNMYSAYNVMLNGGTLSEGINALSGGLTGPLLDGISQLSNAFSSAATAFDVPFSGIAGQTAAQTAVEYAVPVSGVPGSVQPVSTGLMAGVEALTSSTTWATFGILAAIVAAVEAFMGLSAVEEGRGDVYGNSGTRKLFMSTMDPITLAIANFTATVAGMGTFGGFGSSPGGGSSANNMFAAIQRIEFGQAKTMDYLSMAGALSGPLGPMLLPLFAFAAFTKPKTSGTVARTAFEGLLEDKGTKHESRRFGPYWGNVPIRQDGEWVTGSYDRTKGQDFAQSYDKMHAGEPGNQFAEGLRVYIKEQGEAIGLNDQMLKQFIGLGVAFRAALGSQAGQQEQRSLAGIAAMLGSLAASGANVATSMGLVRIEIAKLGAPSEVFQTLNDFFLSPENDIAVEDYRAAIEGLAAAIYRVDTEKPLEFDLSDKNQKGLDIAQEQLDAINEVLKSVPPGVKVIDIAVGLLNEKWDGVTQGVVKFEELDKAIQEAVASANLINPEILNFFKNISSNATAAIAAGTQTQLIESATDAFMLKIKDSIAEAVSQGIVTGFIDAQINTGLLGPMNTSIGDAFETFNNSSKGQSDLDTLIASIQQAGITAIAAIKGLKPALLELGNVATDVGRALDEAFNTDAIDTAEGLAQAIAKLMIAQEEFNNAIDARIAELTQDTPLANEVLNRKIKNIDTEFEGIRKKFFPTLSDYVAELNKNPVQYNSSTGESTPTQSPESFRMSRQLIGIDGPTIDERLQALKELQGLVETKLDYQMQQITNNLNAQITASNKAIDGFQREREAKQEAFQASIDAIQAEIDAKQELIDLRQEEIDVLKEQIDIAQKFADVSQTLKDTIFSMQTGSDSAYGEQGRLSIAQAEFARQQAIFQDTNQTDDKRVAAANKLAELGPQLLQLLQGAGNAQGGEQYRSFFSDILSTLSDAAAIAEDKSQNIEELTKEMSKKQDEIKDIQKDIKGLNEDIKVIQKDSKKVLDNIDGKIKTETDKIRKAQDFANEQMVLVKTAAAGQLEYIRGEGNKLFKEKQDELSGKLSDLAGYEVDVSNIQYNSFMELTYIREILLGHGIKINDDGLTFGLNAEGRRQLKEVLVGDGTSDHPGLKSDGAYATRLREVRTLGFEESEKQGKNKDITDIIRQLFPQAKKFSDLNAILQAIIAKIENPSVRQPLLGFAVGGMVRKPTHAMLGEKSRPELVIPLSAAARTPEVQQLIREISRPTTTSLLAMRKAQDRQLAFQRTLPGKEPLLRLLPSTVDRLEAVKAAQDRRTHLEVVKSQDRQIRTESLRQSQDRKIQAKFSGTPTARGGSSITIEKVEVNSQADMSIEGNFDLSDPSTARKLAPMIALLVKESLGDRRIEEQISKIAKSAVNR